jgi:hypothetical protein
MSDLDDAIARLERAVARLEAAPCDRPPAVEAERLRELAAELAARVDAALARIGRALAEEG